MAEIEAKENFHGLSVKGRGMHPNSRRNLKPFLPGNNGGPGHPGYSLTARLKDALRKDPQRAQEIILSTIEGAILREPTPFKELWERVDGRVVEPVALLGNIQIEVVYRDEHGNDSIDSKD